MYFAIFQASFTSSLPLPWGARLFTRSNLAKWGKIRFAWKVRTLTGREMGKLA